MGPPDTLKQRPQIRGGSNIGVAKRNQFEMILTSHSTLNEPMSDKLSAANGLPEAPKMRPYPTIDIQ